MNLEERIEASKKAIDNYPDWVKKTMKWQGGGETRNDIPEGTNPYGNY